MGCCGDCNKCTNGKCVCDIDTQKHNKGYRFENLDKLKENHKNYYLKNREKLLEQQKVYRELKKHKGAV